MSRERLSSCAFCPCSRYCQCRYTGGVTRVIFGKASADLVVRGGHDLAVISTSSDGRKSSRLEHRLLVDSQSMVLPWTCYRRIEDPLVLKISRGRGGDRGRRPCAEQGTDQQHFLHCMQRERRESRNRWGVQSNQPAFIHCFIVSCRARLCSLSYSRCIDHATASFLCTLRAATCLHPLSEGLSPPELASASPNKTASKLTPRSPSPPRRSPPHLPRGKGQGRVKTVDVNW